MKVLVGTFNQAMALVGAFFVIVKTDEPFAALVTTMVTTLIIICSSAEPQLGLQLLGVVLPAPAARAGALRRGRARHQLRRGALPTLRIRPQQLPGLVQVDSQFLMAAFRSTKNRFNF